MRGIIDPYVFWPCGSEGVSRIVEGLYIGLGELGRTRQRDYI